MTSTNGAFERVSSELAVGDGDGVMAVPRADVARALENGAKKVQAEQARLRDIAAGKLVYGWLEGARCSWPGASPPGCGAWIRWFRDVTIIPGRRTFPACICPSFMRKIKNGVAKRLIFSLCVLGALGALGGCAVYPTSPGYAYYDGYGYSAPAPAYVGPPLYFGLGVWGGGSYGHYRGWHGGRHGGWHGGGYRGGHRGGGGHWHR